MMLIQKAYRYELDPNNAQRTHLLQHAGVARFTYNWGLEERLRRYQEQTGKKRFTSAIAQHRKLTALKKSRFPWMYNVSKCAPQEALRDLDRAFQHFYRRVKTGETKQGFPRFKKKGVRDRFRLYGVIKFHGRFIQLPRLGRVRLKERRDTYVNGRLLSVTVSRAADRWFVSCTVEEKITIPQNTGTAIGVDLGINRLAVTSSGESFASPQALTNKQRKLQRLSRQLTRKTKGSKNRAKARLRLARFHLRVHHIRQDALHKLTTHLAKNHSQIVIEDLNVSGMLQNHKLARAIADVGFYEFRRQLEYKAQWYGSEVVVASRFYPSSKRCSQCEHIKRNLTLSNRTYMCEKCGLNINRDLNAAQNLLAVSCTDSLNACGRREVHVKRQVLSKESGTEHYQGPILGK